MYELIKIFFILPTLLIASVHDIRLRKVPILIWFPAAIAIVTINYFQLMNEYRLLPLNWFIGFCLITVMGIMLSVIIAFLFQHKHMFGAADAKGIGIIGLMYASNPIILISTIFISCISSTVTGIKFKELPWIPSLTLGYLCSMILFGGFF